MSLKIEAEQNSGQSSTGLNLRPWSFGLGLTDLFSVLFFILLSLSAYYNYYSLITSIDQDLEGHITEKIRIVRGLLESGKYQELVSEIASSSGIPTQRRIFLRLVEKTSPTGTGKIFPDPVETPGMVQLLPPLIFEQKSGLFSDSIMGMDHQMNDMRTFHIAYCRLTVKGTEFHIHVGINKTHDLKVLAVFRKRFFLGIIITFIGCGFAGFWIYRMGTKPISKIGEMAALVQSSTLHDRIAASELPIEFRGLADSMNSMFSRLEESFFRLSRFSSDIAHELRTPVNCLRGLVEVALTANYDLEKTREMLYPCLEECNRLSNLINNLLFLAKVENPQTKIEKSELDAKKELNVLWEYYEAANHEAKVDLNLETEENLFFSADRLLFQRALGNLIENALKHTPPSGKIILRTYRKESFIAFEVCDTGSGIPSEHLPHLFDRFYRVDFARSGSSPGVGLGLSIVKGIMNLHGGTVSAKSTPGSGSAFSLYFPSDKKDSG